MNTWRLPKHRPTLKLISILVAIAFSLSNSNIALAKLTETVIDKADKKRSLSEAQDAPGSLSHVGTSRYLAQKAPFSFDVEKAELPEQLGRITEAYKGGSDKTIVFIQDLHVHYGAQKQLANILDYLIGTHGLDLILVEGGITDYDFSYIRHSLPQKMRQEKAELLLKECILNGEEYIDIAGNYDLRFQGIEDKDLYDRNMEAFLKAGSFREEGLKLTKLFQHIVNNLKPRVYNKHLKKIAFLTQNLTWAYPADTLATNSLLDDVNAEGDRQEFDKVVGEFQAEKDDNSQSLAKIPGADTEEEKEEIIDAEIQEYIEAGQAIAWNWSKVEDGTLGRIMERLEGKGKMEEGDYDALLELFTFEPQGELTAEEVRSNVKRELRGRWLRSSTIRKALIESLKAQIETVSDILKDPEAYISLFKPKYQQDLREHIEELKGRRFVVFLPSRGRFWKTQVLGHGSQNTNSVYMHTRSIRDLTIISNLSKKGLPLAILHEHMDAVRGRHEEDILDNVFDEEIRTRWRWDVLTGKHQGQFGIQLVLLEKHKLCFTRDLNILHSLWQNLTGHGPGQLGIPSAKAWRIYNLFLRYIYSPKKVHSQWKKLTGTSSADPEQLGLPEEAIRKYPEFLISNFRVILSRWKKLTQDEPEGLGISEDQVRKNIQLLTLNFDNTVFPRWQKLTGTAPGQLGIEKELIQERFATLLTHDFDNNIMPKFKNLTGTGPGQLGIDESIVKKYLQLLVMDFEGNTQPTHYYLKNVSGLVNIGSTKAAPALLGSSLNKKIRQRTLFLILNGYGAGINTLVITESDEKFEGRLEKLGIRISEYKSFLRNHEEKERIFNNIESRIARRLPRGDRQKRKQLKVAMVWLRIYYDQYRLCQAQGLTQKAQEFQQKMTEQVNKALAVLPDDKGERHELLLALGDMQRYDFHEDLSIDPFVRNPRHPKLTLSGRVDLASRFAKERRAIWDEFRKAIKESGAGAMLDGLLKAGVNIQLCIAEDRERLPKFGEEQEVRGHPSDNYITIIVREGELIEGKVRLADGSFVDVVPFIVSKLFHEIRARSHTPDQKFGEFEQVNNEIETEVLTHGRLRPAFPHREEFASLSFPGHLEVRFRDYTAPEDASGTEEKITRAIKSFVRDNLKLKGVKVPDTICTSIMDNPESPDHIAGILRPFINGLPETKKGKQGITKKDKQRALGMLQQDGGQQLCRWITSVYHTAGDKATRVRERKEQEQAQREAEQEVLQRRRNITSWMLSRVCPRLATIARNNFSDFSVLTEEGTLQNIPEDLSQPWRDFVIALEDHCSNYQVTGDESNSLANMGRFMNFINQHWLSRFELFMMPSAMTLDFGADVFTLMDNLILLHALGRTSIARGEDSVDVVIVEGEAGRVLDVNMGYSYLMGVIVVYPERYSGRLDETMGARERVKIFEELTEPETIEVFRRLGHNRIASEEAMQYYLLQRRNYRTRQNLLTNMVPDVMGEEVRHWLDAIDIERAAGRRFPVLNADWAQAFAQYKLRSGSGGVLRQAFDNPVFPGEPTSITMQRAVLEQRQAEFAYDLMEASGKMTAMCTASDPTIPFLSALIYLMEVTSGGLTPMQQQSQRVYAIITILLAHHWNFIEGDLTYERVCQLITSDNFYNLLGRVARRVRQPDGAEATRRALQAIYAEQFTDTDGNPARIDEPPFDNVDAGGRRSAPEWEEGLRLALSSYRPQAAPPAGHASTNLGTAGPGAIRRNIPVAEIEQRIKDHGTPVTIPTLQEDIKAIEKRYYGNFNAKLLEGTLVSWMDVPPLQGKVQEAIMEAVLSLIERTKDLVQFPALVEDEQHYALGYATEEYYAYSQEILSRLRTHPNPEVRQEYLLHEALCYHLQKIPQLQENNLYHQVARIVQLTMFTDEPPYNCIEAVLEGNTAPLSNELTAVLRGYIDERQPAWLDGVNQNQEFRLHLAGAVMRIATEVGEESVVNPLPGFPVVSTYADSAETEIVLFGGLYAGIYAFAVRTDEIDLEEVQRNSQSHAEGIRTLREGGAQFFRVQIHNPEVLLEGMPAEQLEFVLQPASFDEIDLIIEGCHSPVEGRLKENLARVRELRERKACEAALLLPVQEITELCDREVSIVSRLAYSIGHLANVVETETPTPENAIERSVIRGALDAAEARLAGYRLALGRRGSSPTNFGTAGTYNEEFDAKTSKYIAENIEEPSTVHVVIQNGQIDEAESSNNTPEQYRRSIEAYIAYNPDAFKGALPYHIYLFDSLDKSAEFGTNPFALVNEGEEMVYAHAGTGGDGRLRRSVYLPKLLFEALTYTGRVQNLDRIMPEEAGHARRKVAVRKRGQTPSAETFEDVEDREGEIRRVQRIIGNYRVPLLKDGRLKEFARIFANEDRELTNAEIDAYEAHMFQNMEDTESGWTPQLEAVAEDIKAIVSAGYRYKIRRATDEFFNATTYDESCKKKPRVSWFIEHAGSSYESSSFEAYHPSMQESMEYFHQLIKRRTVNKRVLFEGLRSGEKWAFVCTPFTREDLVDLYRITMEFEISIEVLELKNGETRLLISRGIESFASPMLSSNPRILSSYGHTHKLLADFTKGAEPSWNTPERIGDDGIAKAAYNESGGRLQNFVLGWSKEFEARLSIYKGEWRHYAGGEAIAKLQEIGVVAKDTPPSVARTLHTIDEEKYHIKRAHEFSKEAEDRMWGANIERTRRPLVVFVDMDAVPHGQKTDVDKELVSLRERYKQKYGKKVILLKGSISKDDMASFSRRELATKLVIPDFGFDIAVVAAQENVGAGKIPDWINNENITVVSSVTTNGFIHIEPIVNFAMARRCATRDDMDSLYALYLSIVDRKTALTKEELWHIIEEYKIIRLFLREERPFDREELHELHREALHLSGHA